MARLNPHRRRLAAQAKLLRDVKQEFGPSHDDSSKLQQGVVKSSLAPRVHLTAYATPRDNWEGLDKRGKVVAGKFKPTIPGQKSRFASK